MLMLMYSFSFFPLFLDLLLKHAPDPHFLILEPNRLPNKMFLVSCIFLIILIPIASSFWITPPLLVGWPFGGIVGGKMAAFLPPPDRPTSEEEKEDTRTRRWQCLHATGRQWNMMRGEGQRERGKASRKQMTQLEGGGGRRREASGWRTTQQEGCCCDGIGLWNPPMRVSAYVDSVARQLPLRREKEGRGPIIVKAGEQSTMTVDANTLFHHGAASQRHWDPRYYLSYGYLFYCHSHPLPALIFPLLGIGKL
jgi:hypothetical protein